MQNGFANKSVQFPQLGAPWLWCPQAAYWKTNYYRLKERKKT